MTSCMLAGDRRLAPARKSGMTVLGKVPKPINLPSQKLENQGNDPNVEIVPKGTLTWGSRPSSTMTNAWGNSSISSPNADGSLGSPGTRPSTAGSDRSHEPFSNAWGQGSRPSSASGIIASGQVSASSRPRSAETRPGSSQLSRFADNSVDKSVAWGAAGTSERLGAVASKGSGFNLSSGDFPTLGSDKNSDTNSQRGHSSQGRPLSSQGRPLSSHNLPTSLSSPESRDFIEPHLTGDNIYHNQGTVNTWKADDPQYVLHDPPPNMDHWHRDPHQAPPYPHMNIPPPHYNSWHNPQFRPGSADGSWYNRGGPPSGPYRQPGPPGNYPVDYPQGPPRSLYCEPYPPRPYMQPDRYMGPSHPDIRPGSYPRPMPHEGFYGPPRPEFYSPPDREASLMGMAPPQGHNQYALQNQNFNPANFNVRPSGFGSNVMGSEQRRPDHHHDNQGQYRVLLKHNDGLEERKRDWGTRSQVQETMEFDCSPKDTSKNTWIDSSKAADEGILKYPEATNVMSSDIPNHPVIKKDPTLLEKVEGLNNKVRAADGQFLSKEKTKAEGVVANHEELNVSADDTNQAPRNYRKESENAHLAKQKSTDHEINSEPTDKVPSHSTVNTTGISGKSGLLEPDASLDPNEENIQRTKMREVALQRAKQRQQEEEERTREQKAKAFAKLEELNRRTFAKNVDLKSSQTSSESTEVQNIAKQECLTGATSSSDVTSSESSSVKAAMNSEVVKQVNDSSIEKPSLSSDISSNEETNAKQSNAKPLSSVDDSNSAHFTASITIGTIEIKHNQMIKQKQLVASQSTSDVVPKNKHLPVEDNKNSNSSKNITNSYLNFPPQTQSSTSTSTHPELTREVTGKGSSRPQAQRKVGRNQHANNGNNKQPSKYHTADAVMWTPVKPQIKNEASSHGVSEKNPVAESGKLSEKSGNGLHNGSKAKRAEMERYVPKPVAKEHSQNVNSQQISPHKNSQAVEKGENYNHGKNAEPVDSDPMNKARMSNFGWGDNTDNVLPSEVSNLSVASKSHVSNKQRRQPPKTQKAHVSNQSDSINQHATSDRGIQKISSMGYNERNEYPNASVDHVKPQWQPKSQVKAKNASQIANNAYENKSVAVEIESQNEESGRARKVSEYANPKAGYNRVPHGNVQRGYNSNYRNKYNGDKQINYSDGEQVEYQHAGSYDKNEDYSGDHKRGVGSNEGARVTGSKYRGLGRNYHRGGGNFYARSAAGISAKVGNDS